MGRHAKRWFVALLAALLAVLGLPLMAAGAQEAVPEPAPGQVGDAPRSLAPRGEVGPLPEIGAEVESLRTDRSSTVVTEHGYRTTTAPEPVRFKDADGGWVDIDSSAVRDGEGWRNAAGSFSASYPDSLESPVTVTSGPVSIATTFRDLAGRTVGKAEGPTVTYADVRPGTDVSYTTLASGVKEEITLATLDAAALPLAFDVQVSGGQLRSNDRGSLEVTDDRGNVVWQVPPAFAVDAAGVSAPVATSVEGSTLTLTPDREWLTAPDRAWPVVIDPSYITGVTDCGIVSSSTTPQCSNTTMNIGSASSGSVKSRALIDFPGLQYEVPPTATIRSAELNVVVSNAGNGTPTAVNAHPLTNWWASDATWTKQTSWSNWTTAGGDYDAGVTASVTNAAVTGTKTFDVTDVVTSWVRTDTDRNGFLLKAATEGGANTVTVHSADAASSSNWPSLVVEWNPQAGQSGLTTEMYGIDIDDHSRLSVVAPGYLQITSSDYAVGGTGPSLSIGRAYDSGRQFLDKTIGGGWQMTGSVGPKLLYGYPGGRVVLETGGSGDWIFQDPENDGSYVSPRGINATLVKTGSSPSTWTLTQQVSGVEWTLVDLGSGAVLTEIADRDGNTTTVNYDGSATMTDGTRRPNSITDTRGRDLDLIEASNRIEELQDWDGRTVEYGYGPSGLESVVSLDGETTEYIYDWDNNLVRIRDGRGNDIKIDYFSPYGGRVESITRVDDPINDTGPTWSFNEDPWTTVGGDNVAPATVTDPDSNTTTYKTGTDRQVREVTDPLNRVQANTYTANGNVATYTSALSAVTTLSYNADNRPTSSVGQASAGGQTAASTTWSYGDTTNNPFLATSASDSEGNCTRTEYSSTGHATKVHPGLTPSSGNCDSGTSADPWEYTYNADGTVATGTDPKNDVTSYTYSSVTNHEGELLSIDHPSPLGDESFTYDAVSRVATHTDGKSQVTTYTYDDADRVTRVTFNGDTSCSSRSTCIDYSYDANGNLTSRIDSGGTTSFTYDEQNRVTAKTLPSGRNACSSGGSAMTYSYDSRGNLETACDSAGTITYGYDGANQATSVAQPGGSCGGSPSLCVTFAYDDAGRRTETTFPTSPVVKQTATYDDAGNLTEIKAVRDPSGTPTTLTEFDYTYVKSASPTQDRALRYSVTDASNGVTTTYSYNGQNWLTGADLSTGNDETYGYDLNGNRTSKTVGATTTTYGYNVDQLSSATGQSAVPTYDLNGNETRGPNGRTTSYTAINQPSAITPSGGSAFNMSYLDASSDERSSAGANIYASTITGLSYESPSAGGGTTYRYLRDPLGGLIAQISSAGVRNYYLVDGLGSVSKVINTSGNTVNHYRYDPWGTDTTVTSSVYTPWRYAGGYKDATTGLTKFGTRYYDPQLGRWTQPDHWGPESGYLYAGNDPVSTIDPSGRFKTHCGPAFIPVKCTVVLNGEENDVFADNGDVFGLVGGPAGAICAGSAIGSIPCAAIAASLGSYFVAARIARESGDCLHIEHWTVPPYVGWPTIGSCAPAD